MTSNWVLIAHSGTSVQLRDAGQKEYEKLRMSRRQAATWSNEKVQVEICVEHVRC